MATPSHFEALAKTVQFNLENQHDWTKLQVHTRPGMDRQLLSGLPPQRLYVHPDEQIAIIKAEKTMKGDRVPQPPELEWVVPTHMSEKWTLGKFAAVFDAIEAIPPQAKEEAETDAGVEVEANSASGKEWERWRGSGRGKRILLAITQDDSTIAYYVMHDGVVKPRPN